MIDPAFPASHKLRTFKSMHKVDVEDDGLLRALSGVIRYPAICFP